MAKQPERSGIFSGSEVFTGGGEVSENVARTHLAEGLGHVRTLAVQGLERAHTLATARLETQRRELERLGAKMGASHARVVALQSRIDVEAGALQRIAVHVERAETIATPADPRRWIVHGYVRDPDGYGVRGLTVALRDRSGHPPARIDPAETDESGYFKLSSAGPFTREAPGQPAKGGGPAGGRATRGAAQGAGELVLLAMDGQRTLVTDDRTLSPAVGRIDYREISLKDAPRR